MDWTGSIPCQGNQGNWIRCVVLSGIEDPQKSPTAAEKEAFRAHQSLYGVPNVRNENGMRADQGTLRNLQLSPRSCDLSLDGERQFQVQQVAEASGSGSGAGIFGRGR
jgi:hypothetical protein